MKDVRPIFFTSDLHLFHQNSIEFDKRPFENIEHMHRVLINNYNACVPKDGICYFLGDIGMATTKDLKTIISQLNGTKILLMGNHDKGPNAMYNAGFDNVLWNATIYIGNNKVTMSHCPLMGVWREDVTGMRGARDGEMWHGETKNLKFSLVDYGQYHLHGHTHKSSDEDVVAGKQMDIGVCGNQYRPVSWGQVEAFISKHKRGGI